MRPKVRLFLIFEECSSELSIQAFNCGVDGVILKGAPYRTLMTFLDRSMLGPGSLPEALALNPGGSCLASSGHNQSERLGFEALTKREREIVTHLVRGESNKAIARDLDIAEATVKVHIKELLKKLGVESRTKVALYAVQYGFAIAPIIGLEGG